MSKTATIILALSTFPNKSNAKKAARLVVKEKLAVCVLTIPTDSLFQWKGKVENTKEMLVVFKTGKSFEKRLIRLIQKNHPYSIPFIATLPLSNVNELYKKWMNEELGSKK